MLLFFALATSLVTSGQAAANKNGNGWEIVAKQANSDAKLPAAESAEDGADARDGDQSEVSDQAATVNESSNQPNPKLTEATTDDEQVPIVSLPAADSSVEKVETSDAEREAPQPVDSRAAIADSALQTSPADVAVQAETPIRPVLDLDPQLRNSLESLFEQLIELQENEDAFSPNLGEVYLSYGQALQRAGRLEEARKMYANALHINKINNGVNSVEQRPVLKAMFEMSMAQDKFEAAEETVRRILWLERQHPGTKDEFSFDMVVRLGNRYIDLYLYRPTNSKSSLVLLDKAIRYLKYAVDRYGGRPLNEYLMPYGELALAHYHRSTLNVVEERPIFDSHSERKVPVGRLEIDRITKAESRATNSFGRAERYLKQYLRKAQTENSTEHTVRALLGLADINLLFNRVNTASQYYELAWLEAQELPAQDPLVLGFDSPKQLPSFNYTQERQQVEGYLDTVFVPMTFSINEDGKVKDFSEVEQGGAYPDLVSSARRAAKRLRFRPVIEKGKMIAATDHTHEVSVKVRRRQSDQS